MAYSSDFFRAAANEAEACNALRQSPPIITINSDCVVPRRLEGLDCELVPTAFRSVGLDPF